MESESFGIVLGAMGSIASLFSLIFSLSKGKGNLSLSICLFFILILTATSSYFSYQYYIVSQPGYIKSQKLNKLRDSAKSFINQHPTFRSYWKEGENEGIVKSGLIILEIHRDLFEDNYRSIKSDIEKDIAYSKEHRDSSGQRQSLQTAAEQIYSTMETLAGEL